MSTAAARLGRCVRVDKCNVETTGVVRRQQTEVLVLVLVLNVVINGGGSSETTTTAHVPMSLSEGRGMDLE